MADVRLTSTSYVVLGLVNLTEPASPYRLKQAMERSVADFHPVPHTTFYVEPARLAKAGYLDESQEETGRRRKAYSLSDKGRRALAEWLAEPETDPIQVRFPAMLKIFFGADPAPLARAGLAHHEGLLAHFEAVLARMAPDTEPGLRLSLESGVRFHRFFVEEWTRLQAAASDGND